MASGQFCSALPPEATIINVVNYDYVQADGTRVLEARVDYELSTGDIGAAHIVFDENDTGDLYLEINGEVVVYARYANERPGDGHGAGPATTTWVNPNPSYSPDLMAELLQESVGDVLLGGLVPQASKCSAFGKGVMKAVKYLWIGGMGALGAVCCIGGVGVGCIVCAGGAAAAGAAGADAADSHCD